MVFEFDYVPLAIGLIAEYAPDAVQTGDAEPSLPETPPADVLSSQGYSRLDLDKAIPIWNQDDRTLQNERQSPLLRLPAELKLKIWAMAYEDVAIHVTCKEDGRIGHFICDENRNGFYHDDETPPVMDTRYEQCRCGGSLLEPPYTEAPNPDFVKRRRESTPSKRDLEGIGGMLLACREIYANARDYLYTGPRFLVPTQRLVPRFITSLHPTVRPLIRHLTMHTYSDSWRTPAASGFFGGCCDHSARDEWASASRTIATELPGLEALHLIVHVAGGDSTIWFEDCKPLNCVQTLTELLAQEGRVMRPWKKELHGLETDIDRVKVGPRMGNAKGKNKEDAPIRCWVTAAVESSRHAPGVVGSWVTSGQVRAEQLGTGRGGRHGLRERNVAVLRELEEEVPEEWSLSWWVSVEERENGADAAGPVPWPFNHIPV